VNLLRQRGTFSAAGIGEQICQFTAELDASLMLARIFLPVFFAAQISMACRWAACALPEYAARGSM